MKYILARAASLRQLEKSNINHKPTITRSVGECSEGEK